MRTFPTLFTAEKNRKIGSRPFFILECPFPSTGAIYLSDRSVSFSSWKGGITTKSWVAGWGQISEDIGNEEALTKVSTFTLDIIVDPAAPLTNMEVVLETAANMPETTDCTLYLAYADLIGTHELTDPPQAVWCGNMIDWEKLNELIMQVDMVDRSVRVDKYIGTKLSLVDYSNAHPDDVGKVMNIVYGANNMVAGLRADWSAQTTLKTGISDTETASLELSDASRFPASGSLWIDEEKIGFASRIDNILYTLTRAESGTAAAHSVGAGVIEAKTQYDSIIASHALKTITSIFAEIGGNRLRVDAGVTALVVAGKQILRAIEQITLAPTGQPAIVDTIEVSDPGHAHSDAGAGTSVTGNSASTQTDGSPQWFTGGSSGYAWDGDINTLFSLNFNSPNYYTGWGRVTVSFPAWTGGVISAVYAVLTHECWDANGLGSFTCAGQSITKNGIRIQQKIYLGASYPSSVTVQGNIVSGHYLDIRVNELTLEVHAEATTENIANVSKSGSVTVSGLVFTKTVERFLALVDGQADDALGSVTGTPDALIERPDHVTNHFLYTYGSWPLASFYTDAAAFFGTIYKFSVVLNDYKKLKEWLAKMAWESRCYFRFAATRAELLYRPDTLVIDKTITKYMTVENNDHTSTMRKSRSRLDEVINKIDLHYNRDATKSGEEAYASMVSASDATSATRYGEKEKPDLFKFDFVQSDTMAAAVLAFYLSRFKARKKCVEMKVFLDNSELEFADGIAISELLSLLCEIQKANLIPGSAKDMRMDMIQLTAKEY